MAIIHTNRKGTTYFLRRGVTKTGKTRYFFAREPGGEPVEEIPEGYEIRESVNGVVSLVKARPALLLETEILAVEKALAQHPRGRLYRLEAKDRQITVYEYVGDDPREVFQRLSGRVSLPGFTEERLARFEADQLAHGRFAPVMRFTLRDDRKRRFTAERMRYSGMAHWTPIGSYKPIEQLAREFIPALGSDEFFDLF